MAAACPYGGRRSSSCSRQPSGSAPASALHALGSQSRPSAVAGSSRRPSRPGRVEPGARAAPAFTLRDQTGTPVSLAALRGRPVLLTFLDSQCTQQCPIQGRQLASILRRLPAAQRPVLVVVSVDPSGDTPASIRSAMAKWGLAGPWTWHWLNGSRLGWRPSGTPTGSRSTPVRATSCTASSSTCSTGRDSSGPRTCTRSCPRFVQGDLAASPGERHERGRGARPLATADGARRLGRGAARGRQRNARRGYAAPRPGCRSPCRRWSRSWSPPSLHTAACSAPLRRRSRSSSPPRS